MSIQSKKARGGKELAKKYSIVKIAFIMTNKNIITALPSPMTLNIPMTKSSSPTAIPTPTLASKIY